MYQLGFGINHIVNDLLVRCGRSVSVNSKPLGHVAMYNIYAKKEGTIKSLQGKEEISELASTVKINQLLQVGDQALFAKHNGDVVYEVLLFNNDREQFEADCQVVERQLVIDVEQI